MLDITMFQTGCLVAIHGVLLLTIMLSITTDILVHNDAAVIAIMHYTISIRYIHRLRDRKTREIIQELDELNDEKEREELMEHLKDQLLLV